MIKTNRLILRKPKLSDAISVFNNWANDDNVFIHLEMSKHSSLSVTEMILSFWIYANENNQELNLVIEDRDTRKLIGSINLYEFNNDNFSTKLGFGLAYKYWGKGIMTEAVNAILDYCFSGRFKKVFSSMFVDNIGSRRVLEKNGFKLIECRDYWSYKYDKLMKSCYYAIDKSQWLQFKESLNEHKNKLV